MPPEKLCPMRRKHWQHESGITAGAMTDHDGGEVFAPCLRERCAWWCWSQQQKGEGDCAMLGASAVAYYIAQGTCGGGA